MAIRTTRKTLITAAVNTGAYGADAINGGTPQALQTIGLEITPVAGEELDRELDNGQLGNSPVLMVGTHVTVSGAVELTGHGTTATEAPAFDAILQAGGYEGIDASDSYAYTRATAGSEKDATFYVYKDGAVHKITGARLTITTKLAVGAIPTIEFEMTGLYGGIVTGSIPTPDFSGFPTPAKVGATHTTFKIGSQVLKMLEFEFAENNEIAFDENTVEEAVYLTDFKPDGKVIIEAPDLATFNPFNLALGESQVAITVTHGTTAGNIAEIVIGSAQLGRPTYGDKDGRLTYEIPFRALGTAHGYTFS